MRSRAASHQPPEPSDIIKPESRAMENAIGSQNVMMAGPVDGALRGSPSLQTLNLDLKRQIASFMSVATRLKIATLSR